MTITMLLLLDADGLIKLNRAGVLETVASAFQCLVPESVYQEAVVDAKARGYSDAAVLEDIIAAKMKVQPASASPSSESGFGSGESGVLALLNMQTEASVVISDDRRFLALLARQQRDFLTPSDLIVFMAREGILNTTPARAFLEALRPHIQKDAYLEAIQDIEALPKEKP